MKTISVEYFHDICLKYFQKKVLKIGNIFKIETTMENWFQCEVVLSFVQEGFKVFSSEVYNEKYGDIEDKTKWDSYPGDWKIVTAEASVYNDSRKKADIVIEKDDESIVCEIKLIWMYDEVCRNKTQLADFLLKKFKENEIFKDAEKMQGIAQPFNHRCLTIFASIDKKCLDNEKIDMKEIINECFEKERYKIKKILCDKITSYKTDDYSHFYKDKEYEFVIFLITIELNI
jgi:hypothetical protein